MPPSRKNGLNVARKRRKDGTTIEYFYDRATGKFLGHDRAHAEQSRQRLSLTPLQAAGIQPGSISALIVDYLQSEAYRALRSTTQKLYRGYLDRMREDWGDISARAITRQDVMAIRERLSITPRKANQVLSLLQILLGRAREKGLVAENVAERFGRLHIASRTEIWSYQMEDAFIERARPALQLAYMLLLYTLQRPSDMLAMNADRISNRDGRMFIALRQAKTAALLDVPVHARLAPYISRRLDELTKTETDLAQITTARIAPDLRRLLVPSPTGQPWAHRNFARAWDQVVARMAFARARILFRAGKNKAEVRAELEAQHRQRRDLRRTGIVRLAEAGATTPQIASISGHGIDYCQRIIDTYLPRRTEVAIAGIEVWEKHQMRETMKIVSIAASSGRPKRAS